jgi:hypothetical protein
MIESLDQEWYQTGYQLKVKGRLKIKRALDGKEEVG